MTRSSTSSPARGFAIVVIALLGIAVQQCAGADEYYGKLIGKLSELHHGVSGEVYAVDGRTIFIKDLTYDGEGPAAFFYVGNSKTVGQNGIKIRDERGSLDNLKRYRKKSITLTLPEGKNLNSIKWFCIYCDEYAVNFGDVKIPRNFDFPRPQKLSGLNGVHGVSSEPIILVDAQTLLVPNFSYDGQAPDAKFWAGPGPSPSPQGIRIADENGKEIPLRRYDQKTIVLTLPGDVTVHQLGHFGVWCEAFTVDFGHIQIPQNLNIPPSLKMLGISPQSKLNCEVLDEDLIFEARWAVAGDSVVVQLVGKLDDNQYMSFGLSANPKKSVMVGGDVVVAWLDKNTLQGYAVDYFLDAKSQCSGGRGSCPDLKIQDNSSSVRMLNAALVNGLSIVTYQRPLKAEDELDLEIFTNGTSQAILWAIGPLNDKNEVGFHPKYLKGDRFIDFGRPPAWNCPSAEDIEERQQSRRQHQEQNQQQSIRDQQEQNQQQQRQQIQYDDLQERQQQAPPLQQHQQGNRRGHHTDKVAVTTRRPLRAPATPAPVPQDEAWEIPPIQCYEPEDGIFFAQMGPTGGRQGYPAITGHVGWGISWYINGLLIPEIHVVRNKTYTFYVEGGDNPDIPARYHPFYITDDPVGGYQHKTIEERANITIFAGVRRQRGIARPTGVGRLCNWTPDKNQPDADEFSSFGAYQRTLTLICDPGEPGVITWVPDDNTPDTVYYQCFTHRYLGWKIHVHDNCDTPRPEASEQHEVVVAAPPDKIYQSSSSDLEGEASIMANPSKVTPSPEFFEQHKEYASQDYEYLRNHHHQNHHHHHNHHHPQLVHHRAPMALNNKPAAGPYILSPKLNHYHHLHHQQQHYYYPHYNRLLAPSQLTNPMPAYALHKVAERAEGLLNHQRRIPAKQHLAYEIQRPNNYFVQSNNNNNNRHYYHDHHNNHHPSGSLAYEVHEPASNTNEAETEFPNTTTTTTTTTTTSKLIDPNSQNSQIIPDRQLAMRRPPMYLLNEAAASSPPTRISYTMPAVSSTQNVVLAKDPMMLSNAMMMMQASPPPIQVMLVQRRPQIPSYYPSSTRRYPAMISQLGAPSYNYQQIPPGTPVMPFSKPPVFYERKKAVYNKAPMLSRMQTIVKPTNPRHHHLYNQQPTKLMKVDIKQQPRTTVEVKNIPSETSLTEDRSSFLTDMLLKPARNTGFDPKSIVIEKGFKPIMRINFDNDNNDTVGSEGRSGGLRLDEPISQDVISEKYNGSLEPVFIPSPLDGRGIKKQSKKKMRLTRTKSKLSVVDDMEMAAANKEQLDYVNLPFLTTVNSKRTPKSSSLVILSNDNSSQVVESRQELSNSNTTFDTPLSQNFTKRIRRSTQRQYNSESRDMEHHSDQLHDHANHNHDDHDDESKKFENSQQSSTGEIIMANIEYIFLTIIFYYVL